MSQTLLRAALNITLGTILAGKSTMMKKTKRSKLAKVLRKLKIDSIVPFKEKPSDEVKQSKEKATELFSLFTADIIKEDVEFVR
jgi:hypothetical protein